MKFDNFSLLFGGDTHKDIWESCLDAFEEENHGDVISKPVLKENSDFIKVSHHGSANSSSNKIWNFFLPKNRSCHMAISAGRHGGYKHASSEFLSELEGRNVNVKSTNTCSNCLFTDYSFEEENFVECNWFHEFPDTKYDYWSSKGYEHIDDSINTLISSIEVSSGFSLKKRVKASQQIPSLVGLLYDFEKGDKPDKKGKIVAKNLFRWSMNYEKCFYASHDSKLRSDCKAETVRT